MTGSGRGPTGSRSATLGLAAAATIAAVGAAPGVVQGQDVRREVTLRAEPAGWIGVSIDVPLRADGSLTAPDGLLVSRVMEDSPAGRARLRPGDRIIQVNGLTATVQRFEEMAGNLRPGDRIQLTYEGDGSRNTVTITAAERPDSPVHFLPREMVVRISSKVDSLRFYAVRGARAALTASENVSLTLEAARSSERARPVASSGSVEGGLTIQSGGAATSHREPVRVLLGGDEIRPWFEAVPATDSIPGRLFDVRVDGSEGPAPLMRASDLADALGTAAQRGATLRVRGVRSAGQERESAPSVFTLVERRDLVAGARLTRVGADLATYFDVEGGLLVTEVIEGTPSTEAGLRPGDVLVEVDGQSLEEVEQFRRAWASAAHENRTLALTLVRRGERIELRLPG